MGAVGQRFCACAAFKTTIDIEAKNYIQSIMELIYARTVGITKICIKFNHKKFKVNRQTLGQAQENTNHCLI